MEKKSKAIPYFSPSEMKDHSQEIFEKYKSTSTKILEHSVFSDTLKTFFSSDRNILDLGSANGKIFNLLHSLGFNHTMGADISRYLSVGEPKEGFSEFDFSKDMFPFPDASVDAITSVEVIEHLENIFHFFRECHRVLKQDGVMIFTTPNPYHIYNKFSFFKNGEYYRFLEGNDHITFLHNALMRNAIKKYFSVEGLRFMDPELGYGKFSFLHRFLPNNKFFGRSVLFILRKR
ncbi:MAG: methyltransferase domain-containing protein [Candidatus Paceibacterota bacterium]